MTFATTPNKIAMEHADQVRSLTKEGIEAAMNNKRQSESTEQYITRLERERAALLVALEEWEEYGNNNGGEENYSFMAKTRAAIASAKGLTHV